MFVYLYVSLQTLTLPVTDLYSVCNGNAYSLGHIPPGDVNIDYLVNVDGVLQTYIGIYHNDESSGMLFLIDPLDNKTWRMLLG